MYPSQYFVKARKTRSIQRNSTRLDNHISLPLPSWIDSTRLETSPPHRSTICVRQQGNQNNQSHSHSSLVGPESKWTIYLYQQFNGTFCLSSIEESLLMYPFSFSPDPSTHSPEWVGAKFATWVWMRRRWNVYKSNECWRVSQSMGFEVDLWGFEDSRWHGCWYCVVACIYTYSYIQLYIYILISENTLDLKVESIRTPLCRVVECLMLFWADLSIMAIAFFPARLKCYAVLYRANPSMPFRDDAGDMSYACTHVPSLRWLYHSS